MAFPKSKKKRPARKAEVFENPDGSNHLFVLPKRGKVRKIAVKSRRKKTRPKGIKALIAAADRLRKHLARKTRSAKADDRLGGDNILGVGVGQKIRKGKYTGEWAISVHVRKKAGPGVGVHPSSKIDPKFEKFSTDVLEAPPATPFTHPGAELGTRGGRPGTFGVLLKRTRPSGNPALFILTCNHVASCNGRFSGQYVESPFPAGGQTTQVGLSDIFEPIQAGQTALMDAALIWAYSTRVGALIGGTYTFDPRPGSPEAGAEVFKCGANGTSYGRIVNVDQPHWLDYSQYGMNLNQVQFTGLFFIHHSTSGNHFSDRGDSGAIVFDTTTKRPVGMVIAGIDADPQAGRPEHLTLAVPIETVLAWCGGEFVPG